MWNSRLLGAVLGLVLASTLIALQHFFPELFQRLPYVLLALCVPLALYYLPRYRRSQALIREGVQLMDRDHIVAALEKFEASRPLAKSKVVPTYNIGVCRLQLWQLQAAERELSSLESREDLLPQFRAMLYAALALVAALDGRLKQAVQRQAEATSLPGAPPVLSVLTSAVVACRAGRWTEAREHLGHPGLKVLTGPLRGLGDALDAWCLEQHTGRRREGEAITVFGEASPDSLQSAWPELVSFLLERSRRTG
jgi:hypothetical protein